ncbi:DUF924 family protein [Rubellimicrobium sp. CFH 75288]|uniref:DUF924 family protein n=1 Tax=Rubellimicrobium sp. CFH 75288 TaxID=2697034 RepID=UPI001AA11C21|nr:DUF924 family protein [Rubellimicrobium sp. CFH 75288]
MTATIPGPDDVTAFWLEEVGEARWYASDDALDAAIRDRFGSAWAEAARGRLGHWMATAPGALGYLILLDQFPRNMFRGEARAFATDGRARVAAKTAIGRGWDLRIPEPERQFFYLPLMHSEVLVDQDRTVRLFLSRMPETGADGLLHALAHREQIRRFGRFPGRNAALGRQSTPEEEAFLAEGGQYALYQRIKAARAA